ncbi:hypothetical protein QZH41_002015 [Actinostola sp. cb2023]|nr:hypothetical protein QZH41_002015 [Actinostola sp. cb2023]
MAAQIDTLADQSLLLSMIHGMWQTRCLSVLVGLKIPELLCNTKEHSLDIEEVASKTGCTSTNQIYQIMRVLAQWGIGVELENKHFAKNHAMELLRRDEGPSMGHVVGFFCSEEMWKATVSFPEAVKQNCPAFVLEHGMDNFKYMNAIDSCKYDPKNMSKCNFSTNRIGSDERRREFVENYNQAMSMWSHIQIQPDEPGLKNVYDVFPWSTCDNLMDVGGCSGQFLASILKQPGCEHIQGYVVDLPQVIDRAKANVHDLEIPENRIAFIKQDFTKPLHRDVQNLQLFRDFSSIDFEETENAAVKYIYLCLNCYTPLYTLYGISGL